MISRSSDTMTSDKPTTIRLHDRGGGCLTMNPNPASSKKPQSSPLTTLVISALWVATRRNW